MHGRWKLWSDGKIQMYHVTIYADNKHMFGGKATKKGVVENITEQFHKYLVVGKDSIKTKGNGGSQYQEWEWREDLKVLRWTLRVYSKGLCILESCCIQRTRIQLMGEAEAAPGDGSTSQSVANETCSHSSENRNKASKKGTFIKEHKLLTLRRPKHRICVSRNWLLFSVLLVSYEMDAFQVY